MNIDFHYMIDIYQLSCGVFFAKGRGVEWEGGRRTGGYVKIVQTKIDLQIDPRFQDPNNGPLLLEVSILLHKNDTTYLSLLVKNQKKNQG